MKKVLIALMLLALVPSSALATASLSEGKKALVYGIREREQEMTQRFTALLGEPPSSDGAKAAVGGSEGVTGEAPAEYTLLQKYDKGSGVKVLQARLKELGFLSGKVDGDYGGGTTSAVRSFQESANLQVTGTADVPTQKALFADDAPSAPVE